MTGWGQLILPLAGLVLRSGSGRRIGGHLVAWLVVTILVAVAFAHLIASLQLALAAVLPPALAMLLTALVLLVGAGAVITVIELQRRRRSTSGGTNQIEALQRISVELVRAHPWALVGLAAALGAFTGLGQSGSGTAGQAAERRRSSDEAVA
jgi:hypothetical protein